MATYVITGANRGIGLEFVRQLLARGERVLATCRDPQHSKALAALACDRLSVHSVDVASTESVRAFADALHTEPVDVLINNAGIFGPDNQSFGRTDYDGWLALLNTNTLGPLRVLEALAPNLERGARKLAVTITSGMGSIGDNTSGGYYPYRSSKAAVNMVMRSASVDLRGRGITVVVINPGWVKTDMGGPGASISPTESIAGMLRVFDGLTLEKTGTFLDYRGGTFEW